MPWWETGPWWVFPIGMPIVMLLVMLVAFTMFREVLWGPGRRWTRRPDDEDPALDILRRRFASGEINEKEFEEKRRLLQR